MLEIDAPAAKVWQVLTDFPRYPEWNDAMPSLVGEPSEGSTLSIRMNLGGRPMNASATVREVVPEARFAWRGHLGAEFLFIGIREFTVEPLDSGTTSFRHVETIRGLLVPPFLLLKGKAVSEHHDAFNQCLKQRTEELTSGS